MPPTSVASTWTIGMTAGGRGVAQSRGAPAVPTGVSASCTATLGTTVSLTWSAATNATSYAVYSSTTSGSSGFSLYASGITATTFTTSSLAAATYWFEVASFTGVNWASAPSTATASHLITAATCL
jgi:hypothetical protein